MAMETSGCFFHFLFLSLLSTLQGTCILLQLTWHQPGANQLIISAQPSPGKDLAQVTLGPQGLPPNAMSTVLSQPAPRLAQGQTSTPLPAAPHWFFPALVYSKVTLMLGCGGIFSKPEAGPEGKGRASELVQTGVNWCAAGKGEAKGKARQKELGRRDGNPAKT